MDHPFPITVLLRVALPPTEKEKQEAGSYHPALLLNSGCWLPASTSGTALRRVSELGTGHSDRRLTLGLQLTPHSLVEFLGP